MWPAPSTFPGWGCRLVVAVTARLWGSSNPAVGIVRDVSVVENGVRPTETSRTIPTRSATTRPGSEVDAAVARHRARDAAQRCASGPTTTGTPLSTVAATRAPIALACV